MSWTACNYECLLTRLSGFWKGRVQESLEQPNSHRVVKKKKWKKPTHTECYTFSVPDGLNVVWIEEDIFTVFVLTAQEPLPWARQYQEWLDALSRWDKKQVAKAQSSSRLKHVSTLTDIKGRAHMFNVKDVLKSFSELEPMRFLRSSLPMTLGLAEVAC